MRPERAAVAGEQTRSVIPNMSSNRRAILDGDRPIMSRLRRSSRKSMVRNQRPKRRSLKVLEPTAHVQHGTGGPPCRFPTLT